MAGGVWWGQRLRGPASTGRQSVRKASDGAAAAQALRTADPVPRHERPHVPSGCTGDTFLGASAVQPLFLRPQQSP